jgi:hypothetical protein
MTAAERDWQWTADADADQAWQDWRTAVVESRVLIAAAVADGGLSIGPRVTTSTAGERRASGAS